MNLPLNTSFDTSNCALQARYNMIEQQIRPWNVLDEGVLELLSAVRREEFVPPSYEGMAFTDMEIPLNSATEEAMRLGQHMLAPRVEARMLQDLQVKPTDRVLEIGAGSGYMAALLARSAERVVTLEIVPELVEFARENLRSAGIQNAEVRQADGALDPIPDGPFDVIVLREGGRLGAIVGQQPMMRATFVRRTGDRFETTQPWDVVTSRLRNFPEPSSFRF
jgi:protein-L-isoaspartate(D-aspartate) O-methyltransferase